MFTHAQIWQAVDRLAAYSGHSPSGLAKKAGLDPTTFNKSKRISADGKPRWPSTESISKILAVSGATMRDFLGMIDDNAAANSDTIPVISLDEAIADSSFNAAGQPSGKGWDDIPFPAPDDGPIYGLEVTNDDFKPLFRRGTILVLAPEAEIRRGDRVVVKTTNGMIFVRELIRQTANRIELAETGSSEEDMNLPAEDVDWIARIIWISQ